MRKRGRAQGFTLIEVTMAIALGAIVLAGLDSVVSLGLQSQAAARSTNELGYQGRFALERITAKARTMTPQALAAPAVNTTGNWFAPAMYCLNATRQLIETTTADSGCTGTNVIAANVTAFSAQQPASAGPVDRPLAILSLTLADASGQTIALAASVRLGGGTL